MYISRTINLTRQKQSFRSKGIAKLFFGAVVFLLMASYSEAKMEARESGTPPPLAVSYDGNGNTGGAAPTDANAYIQGATVTTLGNTGSLVKNGYIFSTWNTQADGNGIDYAPGTTQTIDSRVVLFAKYTIIYPVFYNGNGNTGGAAPSDANVYIQGAAVTTLGNTGSLVKIGYTFSTWNTQADGNGTDYAPGTTWSINSRVMLFAKYKVNSYTLTYDANGGTGTETDSSSHYNYNALVTVKADSFTCFGYTFSTWNTAADGSGTRYSPGNVFTMPANAITLYAQWFIPQAVNLSGKVTNQAGNPIANAIVTLIKQAMKDTTGSEGAYTLKNSVSVLPHIMPKSRSITLSRDFIEFRLPNPAPVWIEIFDVKGTLLKKESLQNPPKGFYRFKVEENSRTTKLIVIRASIGQDKVTFRYLSLGNGKYAVNQLHESGIPAEEKRLSKVTTINDTLKITAAGYTTKIMAIDSYSQIVDITLDTATGASFKEYNPQEAKAINNVYATNGAIISSTEFLYVENIGGSGTATVTITYQGYTETQQFPVEAGIKYVLGLKWTKWMSSRVWFSCMISAQLPGLTLGLDRGYKSTSANDIDLLGSCLKVGGPPTIFLIPLSSCSCSEWFSPSGFFIHTNCGLADPNCCNACPSGKACNNGMCQ